MKGLRSLHLKPVFIKGVDDIAASFYLPALETSIKYDRAVGFFSSTIYSIAWSSLRAFIANEGRIRLVCSPVLSEEDQDALEEGHIAKVEDSVGLRLRTEFQDLLADTVLSKPSRVLATLVSIGVVSIQIAYVGSKADASCRRLFHDKLGLLTDSSGDVIAFKGSMNETRPALANDGNLESVDISRSWGDAWEAQRVAMEVSYFERLWNNQFPSVTLRPFPEALKHALFSVADKEKWPDLLEEIERDLAPEDNHMVESVGGRSLRPHQSSALDEWAKQGYRGILQHATGSGKTFTAIMGIRRLIATKSGVTPLILVPSGLLLSQWSREVKTSLSDLKVKLLLCGDGHTSWKNPGVLQAFSRSGEQARVIVSTMQTASSDEFIRNFIQGSHVFLIADEVHGLGSPERRRVLELETGYRLGLSATPHRAGDSEGTAALLNYFGNIIQPPYEISDAIRDGNLTPYYYQARTVELSQSEREEWNKLTIQVRRAYALMQGQGNERRKREEQFKLLLIKRSKILKQAVGKALLARDVLLETYTTGQRWLVYCDDQRQLKQVLDTLRQVGLPADEYHVSMKGDRKQTLQHFTSEGGILVSIKCLDEGVDLPEVSHALILASSRNPREFIQRRGRVLRKAPNKQVAFIFDAIVLPEGCDEESSSSVLGAELARAVEFGSHALNQDLAISDLQRYAIRLGLELSELVQGGFETDEYD